MEKRRKVKAKTETLKLKAEKFRRSISKTKKQKIKSFTLYYFCF